MGTHPGIDIIEIGRIREAIARRGESFLQRLFTPRERAYCDRHRDPAPCYAARFAAKEAIAKALGSGIGRKLSWLDIEISHTDSGTPQVTLSEAVSQTFCDPTIALSMSHSKTVATAIAIRSNG